MPTEIFQVKNFTVAVTPHPSEVVDARVIVNVGSSKEEKDCFGIAHVAEHMCFKSSTRRRYEEMNRAMARLGDSNAHTNYELTVYLLQFLPNDLHEATQLLLELVFEPAFPEDEFRKELNVISEECQMYLDNPTRFFFDQLRWKIGGDQKGHPIIGTLESINATTPEKLRRFVATHYYPCNVLISFVGPITRKEVEEALGGSLPNLDNNEQEPSEVGLFDLRDFHFHHKSKQAIFALVSNGVSLQGEMDASYLPDVFCNALGGGMHSLLFDRVREKLGFCYTIAAYHSSNATEGNLTIYSMLDQTNIEQTVEEARKIIREVKQDGFDSELLDIAKRNYLFEFAKRTLTPSGVAGLVESYFMLSPNRINDYLSFYDRQQRVNSITNSDMREFANRIFDDKLPQALITMTEG